MPLAPTPRSRPLVHIQYRRPPDRTELFVQELVHDDGRVKVTLARDMPMEAPLRIAGRVALEEGSDAVWFTFPGAWHDIGRFHRADGTLTGIYANILTPCTFDPGEVWHTTDLFIDLWIPAQDGRWAPDAGHEPILLDEEELRRAEARRWVDPVTARRAREEATHLMEEARAGRWPPRTVHEWTRERARYSPTI